MESIITTPVSIPLSHIIMYLSIITITVVLGRLKLAIFLSYCFIIYWGQIWNIPIFMETTSSKLNGHALVILGLLAFNVLLTIFGLTFHKE